MTLPNRVFRFAAVAATALVSMLVSAGVASAEQRGVAAGDPADAQPTASGTPSNPDVGAVNISYDSGGSLTLVISYFNAFSSLDTSQRYAYSAQFAIGKPVSTDDASAGCAPELNGQHHVYRPGYSTYFYDRATVTGFDGYVNFTRTVSPDEHQVTLTASGPALANRDWRCATYTLYSRTRSTPSNIHSDYDATCDCWYVAEKLDEVGEPSAYGGMPTIWFNGLRPVPAVVDPKPAGPKVKTVKYSLSPKATLHRGKLRLTLVSGPEVLGRKATVTLQALKGSKHKRYRTAGKAKTFKVTKTKQSKSFSVSRRYKKVRAIVKVAGYTNAAALREYPSRRLVVTAVRK